MGMTREILFQGKRKDNDEWISGDLRQWSETSMGICDRDLKHTFPVRPETVGQFTGKPDKNGKRIFEGDIVEATVTENHWNSIKKYSAKYIVEYHQKYCYFYLKRNRNNLLFDGNWSYALDSIEVIGNIHDNPELMRR